MSEAHVERDLSPSARLNYGPVSSLQLQLVFKIIWAQRFLIAPGHGVAAYYYLEVYVQLYFLPTRLLRIGASYVAANSRISTYLITYSCRSIGKNLI